MARTLLNHWSEYDDAVGRVLASAQERLLIFDRDLSALKLDRPERIAQIDRILVAQPKQKSIIIVQDSGRLAREQPRLLALLERFQHNLVIAECADSLRELVDSLCIGDAQHAVVRFHRDQARSKLLEGEPAEVQPYLRRFEAILGEGITPFSPRATGL